MRHTMISEEGGDEGVDDDFMAGAVLLALTR